MFQNSQGQPTTIIRSNCPAVDEATRHCLPRANEKAPLLQGRRG